MPSGEIMKEFKAGTLHSGKGGSIVKKPIQAKAILMSYLRREGKIPMKHTSMAAHLNDMKAKGKLKSKKTK